MNIDFMMIFDVLLLVFGLYMLYAGQKMKRTGEVSTLIVPESEIQKIRNKKDFISEIYGKMMLFAGIISLYGAYGLITDLIPNIPGAAMGNILGIIIFFAVMIWFFRALTKAKAKYIG